MAALYELLSLVTHFIDTSQIKDPDFKIFIKKITDEKSLSFYSTCTFWVSKNRTEFWSILYRFLYKPWELLLLVDISKSSGRSILDHFMSLRKIILDDDDILISQQFQLFVYFFCSNSHLLTVILLAFFSKYKKSSKNSTDIHTLE